MNLTMWFKKLSKDKVFKMIMNKKLENLSHGSLNKTLLLEKKWKKLIELNSI